MAKRPKCCGNCALWKPMEYILGRCMWIEPVIPFWAHISNGDHGDITNQNHGKYCPTFKEK